jgi:glutamate synthase domain-containing protein 1
MRPTCLPKKEGLYDPEFEHDACGVGFVAHLKGERSHNIVSKGIELLINLEHRGAVGAEKNSGDGAGILTQMPDKFMRKVTAKQGIELPEFGHYGVGVVFLPRDPNASIECKSIIENVVEEIGLSKDRRVCRMHRHLSENCMCCENIHRPWLPNQAFPGQSISTCPLCLIKPSLIKASLSRSSCRNILQI